MKNNKLLIITITMIFLSSCSLKTNPAQEIAEMFGGKPNTNETSSNDDKIIKNEESSDKSSLKSTFFSNFKIFDSNPLIKTPLNVDLIDSIDVGKERDINSTIIQIAYDNNDILYTVDNSGVVSAISIRSFTKLWDADTNINVTSGLCYHDEKLFFGSDTGKLYGYEISKIKQDGGILRSLNVLNDDTEFFPSLDYQLKSEIASPGVGIGNTIYIKLGDGDVVAVDHLSSSIKWIHKGRNIPLSIKGTAPIAADFDNVYVARDDGNLLSLNSDTGKLNWLTLVSPRSGRNDLESLRDVEMIPVIDQGVLFIGFYQGNLAAVDILTGGTIWKIPLSIHSNINIDSTSVYASSSGGTIYSIDRYDGAVKWRTTLDKKLLYTEPHIIDDKIITFSTLGDIAVLDKKNGNLIHYESIIDELDFQTDIYQIDKILYILSKNGRLNAININ